VRSRVMGFIPPYHLSGVRSNLRRGQLPNVSDLAGREPPPDLFFSSCIFPPLRCFLRAAAFPTRLFFSISVSPILPIRIPFFFFTPLYPPLPWDGFVCTNETHTPPLSQSLCPIFPPNPFFLITPCSKRFPFENSLPLAWNY